MRNLRERIDGLIDAVDAMDILSAQRASILAQLYTAAELENISYKLKVLIDYLKDQ